jgi:hypothetical protein
MSEISNKLVAFAKSKIPSFDKVLTDPIASKPLAQLLTKVEASQQNPQTLNATVNEYFKVAVAAAQYIADKTGNSAAGSRASANKRTVGANELAKIKQQMLLKGERVTVKTTGSVAVDTWLKSLGLMS